VLKQGEPCPACGGGLRKAQQPTDAERAHAGNREDPRPLPPHYDTAPREVVDEHGQLWRCGDCGYSARFKVQALAARIDRAAEGS
jgi:ribosomal protein S27AE